MCVEARTGGVGRGGGGSQSLFDGISKQNNSFFGQHSPKTTQPSCIQGLSSTNIEYVADVCVCMCAYVHE